MCTHSIAQVHKDVHTLHRSVVHNTPHKNMHGRLCDKYDFVAVAAQVVGVGWSVILQRCYMQCCYMRVMVGSK